VQSTTTEWINVIIYVISKKYKFMHRLAKSCTQCLSFDVPGLVVRVEHVEEVHEVRVRQLAGARRIGEEEHEPVQKSKGNI
jgi:hypothetical protein